MSTIEHIHTNTCIVDLSAHINMETNASPKNIRMTRGTETPRGRVCIYVYMYICIQIRFAPAELQMQGHE